MRHDEIAAECNLPLARCRVGGGECFQKRFLRGVFCWGIQALPWICIWDVEGERGAFALSRVQQGCFILLLDTLPRRVPRAFVLFICAVGLNVDSLLLARSQWDACFTVGCFAQLGVTVLLFSPCLAIQL